MAVELKMDNNVDIMIVWPGGEFKLPPIITTRLQAEAFERGISLEQVLQETLDETEKGDEMTSRNAIRT